MVKLINSSFHYNNRLMTSYYGARAVVNSLKISGEDRLELDTTSCKICLLLDCFNWHIRYITSKVEFYKLMIIDSVYLIGHSRHTITKQIVHIIMSAFREYLPNHLESLPEHSKDLTIIFIELYMFWIKRRAQPYWEVLCGQEISYLTRLQRMFIPHCPSLFAHYHPNVCDIDTILL